MRSRNLKEGDLVQKVLRDEAFDPRGKMKPRWSGPFIFMKIMLGGATRIIDLDGEEMLHPIIDYEDTTFEKKKKRKKRKLAKLKTRKGGLGKRTPLG